METRDWLREAQQAQDVKTIRHHRGLVPCDKLTTRALRQAFFAPRCFSVAFSADPCEVSLPSTDGSDSPHTRPVTTRARDTESSRGSQWHSGRKSWRLTHHPSSSRMPVTAAATHTPPQQRQHGDHCTATSVRLDLRCLTVSWTT